MISVVLDNCNDNKRNAGLLVVDRALLHLHTEKKQTAIVTIRWGPVIMQDNVVQKIKDPRKLANELILVSLVMVGLLLVWNATTRITNFNDSQLQLAEHSVKAAASEVELYIRGYQRAVDIFAEENRFYLSNVELWPQDMELYSELKEKIDRFFPDNLTFTIAGSQGKTLLEGFEGLVGQACKRDIEAFSASQGDHSVHKHQGLEGVWPHIDIMTHWQTTDSGTGVFFISIKTGRLEEILKNAEVIGHRLMLLNQEMPGKVDVTSSENQEMLLAGNQLSPVEMQRISHSLPVPGTVWDAVILPHNHLYSDAHRTILVQTFLVFLGFLIVSVIMRMILLDADS
ncbi:MAG: hypothetical protein ABFS24_09350 [Pseudomonadota bacterium]